MLDLSAYETARNRPVGRANMLMRWENLLFLHFRVDESELRPAVPDELEIYTFDGSAWLGVVLFEMCDVRFPKMPVMPGMRRFPEFNVRTYVTTRDGQPGVFFLSLDAESPLAVSVARMRYNLPYYFADMQVSGLSYRSHRHGASCAIDAIVDGATYFPVPGSLEYFLVERYLFMNLDRKGRVQIGPVRHTPYPLSKVESWSGTQSLTDASGIPARPFEHACFSRGVTVTGHLFER